MVKVTPDVVAQMQYLNRQGLGKTAIARRLGFNRKTVAKYLKNPDAVRKKKPRGPRKTLIDPFAAYIKKRLADCPGVTAVRLYREISGQHTPDENTAPLLPGENYHGSLRTVRRHVARMR